MHKQQNNDLHGFHTTYTGYVTDNYTDEVRHEIAVTIKHRTLTNL